MLFLIMYLICGRLAFRVAGDFPQPRANLTANKRPVRQILAHAPKLLLENDLKNIEGPSGSDCLLGASLNGDRFNACGISEDTLSYRFVAGVCRAIITHASGFAVLRTKTCAET